MKMTSNKPYLMRAIYEWICDNQATPYLYVDTTEPEVCVPEHLYGDNPLILNISPAASQHLLLGNERISFEARFSGRVHELQIPLSACLAIVARENGMGMRFSEPEPTTEESEKQTSSAASDKPTKTTVSNPKSTARSRPSKNNLKIIR